MTYAELQRILWADFVEKHRNGLQLRCPADSAAGLVHAVAHGYCFDDVIVNGAHLWFDPAMPAEDGDVVIADLHPAVVARAYASQANDPQFVAAYGASPVRTRAIKVLRYHLGVALLICNTGIVRLDGMYGTTVPPEPSRILGVLRYIGPGGNLLC